MRSGAKFANPPPCPTHSLRTSGNVQKLRRDLSCKLLRVEVHRDFLLPSLSSAALTTAAGATVLGLRHRPALFFCMPVRRARVALVEKLLKESAT